VNREHMRNGQKRMRGRNNHRKSQNPLTRVYESNGPDVKIRGTASHIAEKYIQLARDSQSSGDPVAAENYYQHAEHYFRLIAAAQEQFRQQNPYDNNQQPQQGGNPQQGGDDGFDDGDDDQPGQSASGQNEPFNPQQAQPYLPRDAQPFPQNNQQQPHQGGRQHYQQPQHNQPRGNDGNQDVNALPSFITGGGSPQPAGQNGGQTPGYGQNGHDQFDRNQDRNNQDRFGRHRRRRHRGPRPDMPDQAQGASADNMQGDGGDEPPRQLGE
jgi:hypothetical protein